AGFERIEVEPVRVFVELDLAQPRRPRASRRVGRDVGPAETLPLDLSLSHWRASGGSRYHPDASATLGVSLPAPASNPLHSLFSRSRQVNLREGGLQEDTRGNRCKKD